MSLAKAMNHTALRWLFCFGAVIAAAPLCVAEEAALTVNPSKVVLEDSLARRQLLVGSSGADVTHACTYTVAVPA
ncbi:MAG: hypothetical protein ACREHD_17185, partial [Pirellulales bacterium]